MYLFRSAAVLTMAAAVAVPSYRGGVLCLTGGQTQSLPAVVTPLRVADVAAQVDGDITEVLVREGGFVTTGQSLVRIDDRISAAQVEVAEAVADCTAAIELAESELRQARRVRDRMLAAQKKGAVSDADPDLAIADCELASAHVLQAQEQCHQYDRQLKLEQARLRAHVIQAPFNGEILRIEQSVGSAVDRGQPVIRVADITRLRATVFMPFSWFERVQPGRHMSLQASAPLDRLVDARVVSVEPVIDAATETFRCVVEIDNSDRDLPSGFTVVVQEQHLATAIASGPAETKQ